jgi:hypothetical protein
VQTSRKVYAARVDANKYQFLRFDGVIQNTPGKPLQSPLDFLNVRVTRQRYYVYPRAEQNIYRPQDKVTVDIKALDANEQPVVAEGNVKVTRDYWWEVWLDPNGREVKGNELRLLRERLAAFPPAVGKGQKPWRLKFRGYQHEDVLAQMVKTDAEGAAQFQFTREREGY